MGKMYSCHYFIDERGLRNSPVPLNPNEDFSRVSGSLSRVNYQQMIIQSLIFPNSNNSTQTKISMQVTPRHSTVFGTSGFMAQNNFALTVTANEDGALPKASHEVLPQLIIKDAKQCAKMGGVWKNNAYSFDNVLYAFLTLFQVASAEGWTDTLYATMDSFVKYSFLFLAILCSGFFPRKFLKKRYGY